MVGYRGNVDRYIIPAIGLVPLQSLRGHHIQELETSLLDKGLSTTTVLHTHRVLKQALEHAVLWEKLIRNPARGVKAPRLQRIQMQMWDAATINQFRKAAIGNRYQNFFELALLTGMRRSEISGLKWDAINIDKGLLSVIRTLQSMPGQGLVEGVPKTEKSRRVIALSGDTIELLKKIRTSQFEFKLKAGPLWQNLDFVFTDRDGTPMSPDGATQNFTEIVRKNQLPHLTLHGLRHAHATLLLTSGLQPKVISERLGHSSISTTMDTYSHVLPSLQREAAAAIDKILSVSTG